MTVTPSPEVEVGIVTSDADALVRFYIEGLLFSVATTHTFPQGTLQRLRRGAARCKVFQPAGGAPPRVPRDPWFAEAGVTYAALLVDDAAAELARAAAAGATVVMTLTDHRPGARAAIIRDPEGNVWELLEEHE